MPNQTITFYLKRATLLGGIALLFATFFWSLESFAWGVPGVSTSGGGSGPGGGSHSGGVPAPFGLVFLSAGGLFGVSLRRVMRQRRLLSTLPFSFNLVLGLYLGWVGWDAALIMTVLALGVVLDLERQTKPPVVHCLAGFFPILVAFFIPEGFGIACVLPLVLLGGQAYGSKTTKIFGGGILSIALMQEYALTLPLDILLQQTYAQLTVYSLNVLGLGAAANGSVITGLSTEIHVTKVCAGALILANTATLVWFLSSLFVPQNSRVHMLIGLTMTALVLNLVRITSLSLTGHYFQGMNFSVLHDAVGYFTTVLTYTFFFACVWKSAQRKRLRRERG